MYFDALTLAALVDEFDEKIVGGRVQDTIDVDPTGMGLEIYAHRQRRYLYISADQQTPRVHLVDGKLRRGLFKPTQLGLLFRRYVEGGIVEKIHQPEWYERILYIDISHVEGKFRIVVEPMERRANILLLNDDDVILDCIHRVGPKNNSYRLSLPNHDYKLPPPMDRFNPKDVTVEQMQEALDNEDPKQKVRYMLTSALVGFSPLVAQEVTHRTYDYYNQKVRDADAEALHDTVHALMEPMTRHEWTPGIAGEDDVIEAFSVYPLTVIENWRRVESISEALAMYYTSITGEQAYNQAKEPVRDALDEAKAKYNAKIQSMKESLRDESDIDRLQKSGELILAYQYTLDSNQTELVAQYDVEGDAMHIQLNTDLTAVENAQKYFDKYKRAKRARKRVPRLIKAAQQELDYILQLETDLEMAQSWPEIDDVIQAVQERGFAVHEKKVRRIGGAGRSGPMKLTDKDGFVIYVGRNSRQNEQVVFRIANSDDIWLHARDVPGSHVVIRNDGRRISSELIEEAASVAAYYSSKQRDTKVDVDVTRCKYVKAIKGAGPGMVTYRNEDTMTVQPRSAEDVFPKPEKS